MDTNRQTERKRDQQKVVHTDERDTQRLTRERARQTDRQIDKSHAFVDQIYTFTNDCKASILKANDITFGIYVVLPPLAEDVCKHCGGGSHFDIQRGIEHTD